MIRLALRVRREHAELVLAELLELAPGGVEEVAVGEHVIEYAVYGPPGELPALPDVEAVAGGALVAVSTSEIADDWAERWREFHRPLVLGRALTVRAPWEPPGETELDLVIDPGQAFGTGAHATTRLSLKLLLELERDGSFVDLGCGSGVLAIAAARLGWRPVLALDHDPAAVAASRANATANRAQLEVRRHDLRRGPVPAGETIAANLLAPLLLELAPRISPAVRVLIASGILRAEADRVSASFRAHGLREARRRVQGEWAALLLRRGRG